MTEALKPFREDIHGLLFRIERHTIGSAFQLIMGFLVNPRVRAEAKRRIRQPLHTSFVSAVDVTFRYIAAVLFLTQTRRSSRVEPVTFQHALFGLMTIANCGLHRRRIPQHLIPRSPVFTLFLRVLATPCWSHFSMPCRGFATWSLSLSESRCCHLRRFFSYSLFLSCWRTTLSRLLRLICTEAIRVKPFF